MLALFSACKSAPDAIILHQKTTLSSEQMQPRTDESKQFWTESMMVVVQPQGRLIVDFKQETMTTVNPTNKTASRRTFAEAKALVALDNQQKMQQAADYPDDARAELERMGQLPSAAQKNVTVEPTGKTETIAGYEAREMAFSGSGAEGTLWIADSLPLPLGPAEREAFARSTEGMNAASMQFALAMLQANGIPLRTVMRGALNPNGITATNEVVEVRRGPLPMEYAEVPSDYRFVTPGTKPAP